MKCPCCSNLVFDQCCLPLIKNNEQAQSPEALMRSRYSAYAYGDASYILDTYASEKKSHLTIADMQEGIYENKWVKLVIHGSNDLTIPATVEFSAFYLQGASLYEMREASNFIKENGFWRYLDGEIKCHEQVATLKRNDFCPCGSGKKFKKCCGNS